MITRYRFIRRRLWFTAVVIKLVHPFLLIFGVLVTTSCEESEKSNSDQRFGERVFLSYNIHVSAYQTWNKLTSIASKHAIQKVTPLAYKDEGECKPNVLLGIVMIGLRDDEDRNKTQTDAFFHVYCDTEKVTTVKVYKSVKKGETVWLWGPHNPFGLFEFGTEWTSEPVDSSFTHEQIEKVKNIINEIH